MPDEPVLAVAQAPAKAPILFVHIMKTGGTTLFEYLRRRYPGETFWPDPVLDLRYDGARLDVRHHLTIPYLAALPDHRRERIRVYTGHLPLVAKEVLGDPVRTVTILRDPVDRIISLLRQFRRSSPGVQDPTRRPPLADATLDEVYEHPAVFEPLVHNHQTKLLSMRMADAPQGYLDIVAVDDERRRLALDNLEQVDVLGVTERYPDFLDAAERRFGWKVPRSARANESPPERGPGASPALVRRIAEENAIDVELYERARELVALRGRRGPTG